MLFWNVYHGFCLRICHYSGKFLSRLDAKSVDKILTRLRGPEKPTRNDKSKAHAVRREHLLTYSISSSLNEISQVSKARTIAECYLINMFEISLFLFF